MLDRIKDKFFNYRNSDLTANDYKLLYKPFSTWKQSCQDDYDTYELNTQGDLLGNMTPIYGVLKYMTIALFCLIFVNQLLII